MYPNGALAELALRKNILQARIAIRRLECAEAAIASSRPLAMIDRGIATWHQFAPILKLLAIPGGILLSRSLQKRRAGPHGPAKRGKLAMFLTALPLIIRGFQIVQQVRAARAARATAEASSHRVARPLAPDGSRS